MRVSEIGSSVEALDPMPTEVSGFLLESELAQRWRLSVRTLQRWRRVGSGPVFLRLGRRVAYRLSDVERFETAHVSAGGRS